MVRRRKHKRKFAEAAGHDDWLAELNAAAAEISDAEHARFMAILAEQEAESKELGRREMEKLDAMFRSIGWLK